MDAALYLGSGAIALVAAATTSVPPDHDWGRVASIGYLLGGLAALALIFRAGSSTQRARAALAVVVFVAVAMVPLALAVSHRSRSGVAHVKSDVSVIGLATSSLVHGRDPYAVVFDYGPLTTYPEAIQSHYPYLPGSMVFGLAYAAAPHAPLSDPLVCEALVTIAVFLVALRRWEASARIKIWAFQLLLVAPLGAAFLSTSGKEPPTLALMFLSLVLLERGEGVAGGIAAGLAVSVYQLALPLLAFLPGTSGRRSSSRSAPLLWAIAVVAAVSLPFLVWHPLPLLRDTVSYPLGVGQPPRQTTFTPGGLLLRAWPSAVGYLSAAAVAVIVLVAFGLRRFGGTRWPVSTSVAARAGILATVAVLVAPRGRIGYLAFPIDLLGLAYLFREGRPYVDATDPGGELAGRPAGAPER